MEIARCFQSIQLRKSKSGDGAKEQSRQEHEDKGNSGGLLQLEDKRGKMRDESLFTSNQNANIVGDSSKHAFVSLVCCACATPAVAH